MRVASSSCWVAIHILEYTGGLCAERWHPRIVVGRTENPGRDGGTLASSDRDMCVAKKNMDHGKSCIERAPEFVMMGWVWGQSSQSLTMTSISNEAAFTRRLCGKMLSWMGVDAAGKMKKHLSNKWGGGARGPLRQRKPAIIRAEISEISAAQVTRLKRVSAVFVCQSVSFDPTAE